MNLPRFEPHQWKDPLWVAFPDVSPGMYPRPDAWNTYGAEWAGWYFSLSLEERCAYEEHYPEPDEWKGFYRFIGPSR